jgi:hypothetical protein
LLIIIIIIIIFFFFSAVSISARIRGRLAAN